MSKPKGRFSYNMGYRVSPTKAIKVQVDDNYEFVRYQINDAKPSKWIELEFEPYDEDSDLARSFVADDGNKYFLDDFEVIRNENEYK